ncbi:MAG: hypothetical protein JO076_05730 [Verrucomicrobia bacterium]|nr:hypothetical protein [Verrucomicrobiota bacterium]
MSSEYFPAPDKTVSISISAPGSIIEKLSKRARALHMSRRAYVLMLLLDDLERRPGDNVLIKRRTGKIRYWQ